MLRKPKKKNNEIIIGYSEDGENCWLNETEKLIDNAQFQKQKLKRYSAMTNFYRDD